jgi:hypothetical protein
MQSGGIPHPRGIGVANVEAFLSMLANERKISASTHNRTGIPRSRIRSFACCTVYSP